MTRAYIGLGSNLGQPERQVEQALASLARLQDSQVVGCSPRYWTPPWGDADQPVFLNAVVELETGLDAFQLLAAMQAIESGLGRQRHPERRWGPRAIDLDLLMFDEAIIDQPGLVVPHPRMHTRAFVLKPLADLAPGLTIPGRGPVAQLLAGLDCTGIRQAA